MTIKNFTRKLKIRSEVIREYLRMIHENNFEKIFDYCENLHQKSEIKELKKKLFEFVEGDVLETGVGVSNNID